MVKAINIFFSCLLIWFDFIFICKYIALISMLYQKKIWNKNILIKYEKFSMAKIILKFSFEIIATNRDNGLIIWKNNNIISVNRKI